MSSAHLNIPDLLPFPVDRRFATLFSDSARIQGRKRKSENAIYLSINEISFFLKKKILKAYSNIPDEEKSYFEGL